MQLLDAREQVRARSAVGVVRGALVRVLAVGEVEHLVECEHERLGERLALREPCCDRSLVRRGGGERLGGELAPGLQRDLSAGPELVEDEAVPVGAADGDAVREVLRRAAQHRRPADVDHLDGLLLRHALSRGHLLERIEVDADEVERLDALLLERGHILGVVAPREDSRVDARVQRLHAPTEHLRRIREGLDVVDLEAELLEMDSGAAARDERPTEARRARERTRRAPSCRTSRSARAQLSHHLRQQLVLDRLDALVQRLGRVVGEHRNALLREDRATVDTGVDEMDGRAGFRHARGELLLDRVRAGKARGAARDAR